MKSFAEVAFRHAQHLSVEIGSRTIGSSGNHAAEKYIASIFQAENLHIETQEFSCPDWIEIETRLEFSGKELEASANTFSPSVDITAPTIAIGTLAELENAEIEGSIPVFYGALAQSEIAAKGAIYVSERDRRIIQLLETRGAVGAITINPTLHARWRLLEDFDLNLPSVTVSASSGLELLKKNGDLVRMCVVAHRLPSRSANVIGRLAGELTEKIVICAHYDAKVDTPGAYDNAGGVAAILSLAGSLKDYLPQPRHTIEFVAFSGEEIYGLGDMTYAGKIDHDFSSIAAAINFDGIGPLIASNSIAVFSTSEHFSKMIDRHITGYPGVVRIDPWPASDHYIFYSNGVPSIALSSVGIRDIYHTPADTIDWLSPGKLDEAIRLALEILIELDTKDISWGRLQ
jgi:Zn-dependent M28 family amino/carboxypeptidase